MVNTRSDNEHRLLLIPRNVVDTTNRTQYVHDFSAYEEINKGEDLLHYAEQECQRFISQSSSKQRWVTYIEHEYMDGEAAAGYLFNGLAHMGYDISIIDQYTTIWDLFKRKHIFKAVTASRLILNQKRSRKLIAQLIFTIITPLLALLAEKISLIVDINDATDSVTLRIIIYITILGLVILQLLQLKKKWSEEDRAAVDEHLKKIYTTEYQAFINHLPDQFTMMRDRLVIVNEWNNCDPVIRKVLHAMITYEIEQEYSIESDPLLLYIFLPIGYEKPPKGRLWRENVVSLVPLTYQEKEDIVSAFDLSIDKTTLKTCGADVLYKSQIRLNTSIEFPASYTLLNNYLKELLDAYGSNFKFKKYNALYLIIKLSALYGRYFSEDDAIKLLRYQGNGMDGIGSICQRYQNECLGVDSIKNIRNFFHKVFEIVNKYTGDEYFETFFEGKTILVRFKPLFLYCFENVHFAALGLRQDINIWLLSIVLSEESQWSYCVYASRDYLNITADSSIPAQVIIELTFAILRYSEQRDFYLYHSDILMRIVNIQAVGVIPADRFKQLKDVADRMLFFCPSDNVQDTHLKFLSMLHNKKEKRNGDRQADIPVYLRILDMEKEERARYFYLLSSLECGSTLVLYEILYSLRQEALNFHPNSVYSLIGLYEPPARVEILDKVSSLLDVLTNMLPPTLCESQSAILMLKIRDVIEKFRYQFLAPWFDNDEVSDHYTNRGENGVGYTQKKPELIRTYLEASEVLKTLEQELTEKEQNGKDPKEEEIKGLKRHIASIQLKKKY